MEAYQKMGTAKDERLRRRQAPACTPNNKKGRAF
jgi:hypothetical protein